MIDCSEKLRLLREAKHLTQAQVAERIGMSKAMISAYETASKAPSVEALMKLSRLYRVSVDYLLFLDSPKHIDVSDLDDETIALIVAMVDKIKREH